jgi:hypothetical protein
VFAKEVSIVATRVAKEERRVKDEKEHAWKSLECGTSVGRINGLLGVSVIGSFENMCGP